MKKNKFLTLILIITSIEFSYSQIIDTVYFDLNGEIIIKEVSTFYRIAKYDTLTGRIIDEFKDYITFGDSLIARGKIDYSSSIKIINYLGIPKHKNTALKMCKLKASYIRINDYPELRNVIEPSKTFQETVNQYSYNPKTEKIEKYEFFIVESDPEFIGGMKTLSWFISNLIKYPEEAVQNNITGVVKVKFTVDTDGSIKDASIIHGIGSGCDKEALKVVEALPDWLPGMQRGEPVKTYFSLPITFQ